MKSKRETKDISTVTQPENIIITLITQISHIIPLNRGKVSTSSIEISKTFPYTTKERHVALPRNFLGGLFRSPDSGCTTQRSSTRLQRWETWVRKPLCKQHIGYFYFYTAIYHFFCSDCGEKKLQSSKYYSAIRSWQHDKTRCYI